MNHEEICKKLQGQKIIIRGTDGGYEIRIKNHGNNTTTKVVWIPDDDYYILKNNAISFRYDDWIYHLTNYNDYFMLSRVDSAWN